MLSSRQRIKIPDSDVLLHVPVYKLARICVKKKTGIPDHTRGVTGKRKV